MESRFYRLSMLVVLFIGLAVGFGTTGTMTQRTISVCPTGCDYASIQEAIDTAEPGDMITVGPGTYQENLVIEKPLTLKGAGPDQATVVGLPDDWPEITIFIGAEGVTVEGFTIRSTGQQPIGVWVSASSALVQNNRIRDVWFGIEIDGCRGAARNVELVDNDIQQLKGVSVGIGVGWAEVLIHDNTITHNGVGIVLGFSPPESVPYAAQATVVENRLSSNRIGLMAAGALAEIAHNEFSANATGIVARVNSVLSLASNSIRDSTGDPNDPSYPGHAINIEEGFALISANELWDNAGDGIHLKDAEARILGNTVTENKGNGITLLASVARIGESPFAPLFGNGIFLNEGFGLFADPASTLVVCSGNYIKNNQSGDYSSEELRQKCEG